MPKKKYPHPPALQSILILVLCIAGSFVAFASKEAAPADVLNLNEQSQISTQTAALDNTATQHSLEIPIFMYHHIRKYFSPYDDIGNSLSVDPNNFAEQLDYIKTLGYTTITFKDIDAAETKGATLPEKPIILTFDDGYENFYTAAFPLLRDRGMTAVIYVIANKLDTDTYLTTAELKGINQMGFEVGSHTLTHPDLTTLVQINLTKEIFLSKLKLESITKEPVISFCYPFGKYSYLAEETVKNSGYKYATTTKGGLTKFEPDNLLTLPRYRVNAGTDITKYLKH